MGAEFDPSAPWNQRDPEPREFRCEVTVTVSRSDTVATTSYAEEAPEYPDYAGGVDLSNVNWEEDYYDNSPDLPTLLSELAARLEKWMPAGLPEREVRDARELIEQARGWKLVETEVEPE